jgi:N6-adenosine-specific RNA methylase IME4
MGSSDVVGSSPIAMMANLSNMSAKWGFGLRRLMPWHKPTMHRNRLKLGQRGAKN